MRLLCAIAHFHKMQPNGAYGSLRAQPAQRAAALAASVFALHAHFGTAQALVDGTRRRLVPSNQETVGDVDIVLCTTGDSHLLDRLAPVSALFRHCPTTAAPMLLGYECHEVLRQGLGRYDWFAFLEDDILVSDPYFLRKLQWFAAQFGDDCLLQPNRYELDARQPLRKLYIDGNLANPAIGEAVQDMSGEPRLAADFLGGRVDFIRVNNPHSGCFFLNARQMANWASKPYFLDRDTSFAGPLESAATLGIARTFRVYKPERRQAAFLEVCHQGNRYLGGILKLDPADPRRF